MLAYNDIEELNTMIVRPSRPIAATISKHRREMLTEYSGEGDGGGKSETYLLMDNDTSFNIIERVAATDNSFINSSP